MELKHIQYEKEQIKDLSFYCVLDLIDYGCNFNDAERDMKLERNRYLSRHEGFEEWKIKRGRLNKNYGVQNDKNYSR